MNRTFDKIIDMSLIRTVIEIVLRPIDGTTKIKSYTFVRMEAGKGSAEYPRTAQKDTAGELAAYDLVPSIKKVAEIVGSRVDGLRMAFNTVCQNIEAFNNISGNEGVNPNEAVISVAAIAKAGMGDLKFNWAGIKLDKMEPLTDLKKKYKNDRKAILEKKPKEEDYPEDKDKKAYQDEIDKWYISQTKLQEKYQKDLKGWQEKVNNQRNKIETAAKKLQDSVCAFTKAKNNFGHMLAKNKESFYSDEINMALSDMAFKDIDFTKDTTKNSEDWPKLRTHYMRTAVYNFLTKKNVTDQVKSAVAIQSSTLTKDDLDGGNWEALVNDFVKKPKDKTVLQTIGVATKDWFLGTYISPWKDMKVNRKRWRVGLEGKILLSDSPDNTISFEGNGEVKSRDNAMFTNKTIDKLKSLLMNIGA
jgi:hypothetical protein